MPSLNGQFFLVYLDTLLKCCRCSWPDCRRPAARWLVHHQAVSLPCSRLTDWLVTWRTLCSSVIRLANNVSGKIGLCDVLLCIMYVTQENGGRKSLVIYLQRKRSPMAKFRPNCKTEKNVRKKDHKYSIKMNVACSSPFVKLRCRY